LNAARWSWLKESLDLVACEVAMLTRRKTRIGYVTYPDAAKLYHRVPD